MDKNEDAKIGKVLLIPDDKTLIIDVGYPKVKRRDELEVFESMYTIKKDEKSIGQYVYVKAVVTVIDSYEKYRICRKMVDSSLVAIVGTSMETSK